MARNVKTDPNADGAAMFASAVRRLFALAGSPTVVRVAGEVGVSAATVSNWRTGRHIPGEFETIEPMLVWLTARATSRAAAAGRDSPVGEVLTVRQWQELFNAATGRDAVVPVLGQIADAAGDWARDAAPLDVDQARRLLLCCIEISPTGALAHRIVETTESMRHVATQLLDLGVLAEASERPDDMWDEGTPSSAPACSVQLADIRLVDVWSGLSAWVHDARTPLIARSALEQDAHRWLSAGRPRTWLYDHVRLAQTADALLSLGCPGVDAEAPNTFRFGEASADDVPRGAASEFWVASQGSALTALRVHQLVATVGVVLIVMVIGLGLTLGVVIGNR